MTVNTYTILAMGEHVSVIQMNSTEEFYPFILKGQMLYSPRDGFRPHDAKKRQRTLDDMYLPEANELLAKAETIYSMMKQDEAERMASVPTQVEPQSVQAVPAEPVAVVTPQQPTGLLESLIAQSVAQISVNTVMEAVKPIVDEFIRSEYGVLPVVHEVRTPEGSTKISGIVHEKFDEVLELVMLDIPVFLSGPAGTGKSKLSQQVAEAIGLDFYFSNAVTQEYKVTGFIDANGHYHTTQFYEAFTKGGVFMLDEIDASVPEVLVCLNTAIAQRYYDFPNGRQEAHENFRLIAAGNTWGSGADIQYTGRYQLDESTLDRFGKIQIDYSPAIEEALSRGDNELVTFIRDFRKATHEAHIKKVVSYRALERVQKLASGGMGLDRVLEISLVGGMNQDDLSIVCANMKRASGRYMEALRKVVTK
jgi:MoxR-like ATPase